MPDTDKTTFSLNIGKATGIISLVAFVGGGVFWLTSFYIEVRGYRQEIDALRNELKEANENTVRQFDTRYQWMKERVIEHEARLDDVERIVH